GWFAARRGGSGQETCWPVASRPRILRQGISEFVLADAAARTRGSQPGTMARPNPPIPPSLVAPTSVTNQWEEVMKANYKTTVAALASVVLGLAVMLPGIATALAQDTVRVRGTIERLDGSTYLVKARDGAELKVALADNPQIAGGGEAR